MNHVFDAGFLRRMRIFVSRMKRAIIIVSYWLTAIFMTALLLTSLDYDLWEAILMTSRVTDDPVARRDWLRKLGVC